jgi:nitroreductase
VENQEYEKLLEIVKNRRSVRRFKSDPIPDEYIDKIIEVARWAPSGFNTQPWEFVVLKDKKHRQKIVDITASFWKNSVEMEKARPEVQGKKWDLEGITNTKGDFSEAPVYIILFGDPRVKSALPMAAQCDPARSNFIYQSSLSNAFLQMQLAATTLGLGAQWYTNVNTPYNSCLIKEYLGIPLEFDIFDMMVLGYPDYKPRKKFLRKKEEMVHWGTENQGKFRSDEKVKDFNKKTRAWVMGIHAKKALSE